MSETEVVRLAVRQCLQLKKHYCHVLADDTGIDGIIILTMYCSPVVEAFGFKATVDVRFGGRASRLEH